MEVKIVVSLDNATQLLLASLIDRLGAAASAAVADVANVPAPSAVAEPPKKRGRPRKNPAPQPDPVEESDEKSSVPEADPEPESESAADEGTQEEREATIDDVRDACRAVVSAFAGTGSDAAEAKKQVEAVLQCTFGVSRTGELKAEQYERAVQVLNSLAQGRAQRASGA